MYKEFTANGLDVHILYWKNKLSKEAIIPQTQLPDQNDYYSAENIAFLNQYIVRHSIDVLINQSGLNNRTSLLCVDACKKTRCKLVTVLHNSPDAILRMNRCTHYLMRYSITNSILNFMFSQIQRFPFYKGGRYIYDNSDKVILLSNNYRKMYEKLYVGKSVDKVLAINNPLTISTRNENFSKDNIVLFIGRLSAQKSLGKLLYMWRLIESDEKCNSWRLVVLGDGEEKKQLISLMHKLQLMRVEFKGFVDPNTYLNNARILCMTSIFEGFPMVLVESKAYGVVPMAYDSFASLSEIIRDGINGYIIPPFSQKRYIEKLKSLIINPFILEKMSEYSRKDADRFCSNKIISEWILLFSQLK